MVGDLRYDVRLIADDAGDAVPASPWRRLVRGRRSDADFVALPRRSVRG